MSADRESSAWQQHRNILFAFALAVLLYYVYVLRAELTLIYVSALAAVVLQPVAKSIMRIRIGKWHPNIGLSVIVLILAIVAFFALFAAYAIPPVYYDLRNFITEFPAHAPRILEHIKSLPFMEHLNVDALNAKVQDFTASFAAFVFHSASNWVHSIFALLTGIFLTIYFMIEGDRVYAWGLKLVPIRHRPRLDRTLTRAKVRMGRWLLGQGALMLILGICSTIVFVLLHVRYAYALGVLMGLFNIIPVVGAMITVSLALLVAALDSWGRVIGVAVFYAIYAQIENSILIPSIMQSSVNIPGVAVLIALVIGSALAGIAGAAVSIPSAVLLAVLIEEYLIAGDHPHTVTSSTNSKPGQ